MSVAASSEPEVLEVLHRTAVQVEGLVPVPQTNAQIGLRGPDRCTVAPRGELVEGRLGGSERLCRLLETSLLEERAPQDELRVSMLVEVVDPVLEQDESLPCVVLGQVGRA